MTYLEAEALKQSLKSDTYTSKAGNKLKIYIAPQEAEGLKVYKEALKYNWPVLQDKTARQYTLKDHFVLYGIRQLRNGKFAGGVLELKEHPELLTMRS